MPPPPIPRDRPASVLTTVSYATGAVIMGWAFWRGREEFHVPRNAVITLTVPGLLAIGAAGSISFGMGFAMLGYTRGEPKALRALWLVPVLAVTTVVLRGVARICGIF